MTGDGRGMTRCDWFDRIEAAALRGTLGDAERAHIRECAECRKTVDIVQLLVAQGRKATEKGRAHVPSAQAVLARARQIRARKRDRAVLRPVVWIERISWVVAALTLFGAWLWIVLRAGMSSVDELVVSSVPQPDLVTALMVAAGLTVAAATWYGFLGLSERGRERRAR